MGLRVEDMMNGAISNVFDAITDAKTKKTEKAFAAFLDNAAKSNLTTNDYLSSNGVVPSSEEADSAKTDMKNTAKSDAKLDSSEKEIKSTDDVSKKKINSEDVSADEEQLVADIESAIKEIVAQQLGITIEEVDSILSELDMNAIDLLQGNNLLEFVMQVNGIDDMSAVLTDETLMNQLKELADEIDFAVSDVLAEQGISKEILPQIVETVKSSDETEVANTTSVKNEETVIVTEDTQETQVVIESNKADTTQNNEYASKDNGNESMPMESHGLQQNQATQIVDALSEVQTSYTSVDMEEIVNQIVEQIKVQITEESTSMEMQLNPESYGKMQLQVVVKDGIVTAQMAVENEAVRNALEAQVVQLREEMNNQGVKVEAIEVTIASHEFERNLEQDSNASEQAFEEAQAKATRQRMNLNLTMEDLSAEDIENMSDAEVLERKIMLESGNRMSIQA